MDLFQLRKLSEIVLVNNERRTVRLQSFYIMPNTTDCKWPIFSPCAQRYFLLHFVNTLIFEEFTVPAIKTSLIELVYV